MIEHRPKFITVSLDGDEVARCPDIDCTYNRSKIRKQLTAITSNNQICAVYCPYCRDHLIISKDVKG